MFASRLLPIQPIAPLQPLVQIPTPLLYIYTHFDTPALRNTVTMVQSRPKPSEVAAEAKRIYHPHIARHYIHNPVTSYLYSDGAALRISPDKKSQQRLRVAVVEGDAVDYALGWYQYAPSSKKVPVVNMANEKRAGGDWESGLMAPEECFARRSNLVQALTMPYAPKSRDDSFYPLPQRGGLYTPEVCMYTAIFILTPLTNL